MTRRPVPASGTVSTPPSLAQAVVNALGDEPKAIWLDPCVGDGAFIAALSLANVPADRIRAYDLTTKRTPLDRLATTRRGIDFIRWSSRRSDQCDRVIMNPPYVAIGRLRGKPRLAALEVETSAGTPIRLQSNYWCAFLLRGLKVLRPGGSLAAILPATWDFAKYAQRIREAVGNAFGEVTVVRSAEPLFPDVLEGAVILIAKKRGTQPSTIRRIEVPTLESAVSTLTTLAVGRVPSGATVIRSIGREITKTTKLGELMRIRIGGVTGDASYFLLTEEERREHALPQSALRPVLTRSKHLRRAVVTPAEWRRIRDDGERVWLFSPSPDAVREHPAVRRYVRKGREGAAQVDGYKLSKRDPWYQTPMPGPIDGFISGMSRRLPFLAMRSMPRLAATNTLYVVSFKPTLPSSSRFAIGVALLTSRVRREMESRARVYADGLLKFEPAELASICIPVRDECEGARAAFVAATRLLLAGNEAAAEGLADEWFANGANRVALRRRIYTREFSEARVGA